MPAGDAFQAQAWALARQDLLKAARRHALAAYALGVTQAQLDLGVEDLYDARGQEFAAQFSYKSIRSLTAKYADQTQVVIADALRRGLGVDDIAHALDDFLMGAVPTVEVIARTEANRAANWGRFSGWRASGMVQRKEFIATLDERVDPTHLEAHGEVVGLDEPFSRGAAAGYLMPPLRPNCRCTAAPVTNYSGVGPDDDEQADDAQAAADHAEDMGFGRSKQPAPIRGVGSMEDRAAKAWREAWVRHVPRMTELVRRNPLLGGKV